MPSAPAAAAAAASSGEPMFAIIITRLPERVTAGSDESAARCSRLSRSARSRSANASSSSRPGFTVTVPASASSIASQPS